MRFIFESDLLLTGTVQGFWAVTTKSDIISSSKFDNVKISSNCRNHRSCLFFSQKVCISCCVITNLLSPFSTAEDDWLLVLELLLLFGGFSAKKFPSTNWNSQHNIYRQSPLLALYFQNKSFRQPKILNHHQCLVPIKCESHRMTRFFQIRLRKLGGLKESANLTQSNSSQTPKIWFLETLQVEIIPLHQLLILVIVFINFID